MQTELVLSFDKKEITQGIAEFLLVKDIDLDEYKKYPILSYIRKAFYEFYQGEEEFKQILQKSRKLAKNMEKNKNANRS